MRLTRLCLLGWMLGLALAWSSAQAQRVALVIGNGAYQHAPRLTNPVNDARAIADALERLGFRVTARYNHGRRGMAAALREFGESLAGAEVALVFFAGHGMQAARGGTNAENYLLPVDARLADIRDLEDEALSLGRVLDRLDGAASRIVILDACRDNPLIQQTRGLAETRSVARGLAPVTSAPRGTLVAFSTAPGALALDGRGANSPFTAALIEHLPTPGLEVRQVLTRVRERVHANTNGAQTPWNTDGLFGDVFLAGARIVAPATPAPVPSGPSAQAQMDTLFWQGIQASTDPADYAHYLQRFPDGLFAELARRRLEALRAPAAIPPPAPAPAAPPPLPAPVQTRPLQRAEIQEAQRLLTAMGFDSGGSDGVAGARTREAMRAFGRAANLSAPPELTLAFLELLRQPPPEAPQRAEALLDLAEDAWRARDAAGALRLSSASLRLNPSPRAQLLAGDAALRLRRVDEARQAFEAAQRMGAREAAERLAAMRPSAPASPEPIARETAEALFQQGRDHETGRGVPRNDAEAARLYRLAANQGHAVAQYNLALLHANGRGAPQSDLEATRLFRLAAGQGLAEAQYNLAVRHANGRGVARNDLEAVRLYRLAADQGLAHALHNLGWMYQNGRGVPQNDAEAARLYRLAGNQGHASGQIRLGLMFVAGRGVPQNDVEAVRLFRLAANQGDARGQYNLGFMYAVGRGVAKNDAEAVSLFQLAARQGHEDAQAGLRRLGQTW